MKQEGTLTRFLKDHCANYNKHYGQCVYDHPCKVLEGKQCGYFEKAVLGPPEYKHKLPGYDYAKLFAQYASQTGASSKKVTVRRCPDCQAVLRPRQRYCEDCSKKRLRKNAREHARRERLKNAG